MKILAISDKIDPLLDGPALHRLFGDADVVLGCGDLPQHYLEYVVTVLGGPLFYVVGNHYSELRAQPGVAQPWIYPEGCENLHGRVVRYRKLLLAGLEGSMRYNSSPHFQYTESEMAWKVWRLVPSLLLNRLMYGRYLDILITHAPPAGIHDQPDLCHRGFRAFRSLMDRFRPRYLVHGHVHVYHPKQPIETVVGGTTVINAYGHRLLEFDDRTLR